MKVRTICTLATALGVWVGGASAAEPAKAPASKAKTPIAAPASTGSNQQLADAVANKLTTIPAAADMADITLSTEAGVVTVMGFVKEASQKKAILDAIRVVPGVKMVRDGVTVGAIQQVQAQAPVGPIGPIASNGPVGMMPDPRMMDPRFAPGSYGNEPAPLGQPGAGPSDGFAPPLPPNAWPTYAPHNNLSRVAYPTAYPANAFPFIGPFYPFPKVPLGWRSVSLDWEDGHWWMGRKSAPHDYWRVRFW